MYIKKIHRGSRAPEAYAGKGGLKAEGKDRIIQDILDAIPENGEWDGKSEEFVADSMRAIVRAGLGRAARITGQHVGDDDPCRYDVDFDYDGCKCVLRAVNDASHGNGAYMDLYVQNEKDALADAWGPENGIETVSSFADVANGLCAKVKNSSRG